MGGTAEHLELTSAKWHGAIQENCAVGDYQSNGRAEHAVRHAEDMVKCFKANLEHKVQMRSPIRHPSVQWLVECMGVLISKYHVLADGTTSDEHLDGQTTHEGLNY